MIWVFLNNIIRQKRMINIPCFYCKKDFPGRSKLLYIECKLDVFMNTNEQLYGLFESVIGLLQYMYGTFKSIHTYLIVYVMATLIFHSSYADI